MNPLTTAEIYNRLQKTSAEIFQQINLVNVVDCEEQDKQINILKQTLEQEKFFFVFDIRSVRTEQQYGFEKWLGYANQSIDILSYLETIHPSHRSMQHLVSVEVIKTLCQNNHQVVFLQNHFANNVAIRRADGKYLLCKRLMTPFQIDSANRPVSLLYEFTIIKLFENEKFSIRKNRLEKNETSWEKEFSENLKLAFEKENIFSIQELRILRRYANDPSLSAHQISSMFKTTCNTIYSHHKNIIAKAEHTFSCSFKSAKDVAQLLRSNYFI